MNISTARIATLAALSMVSFAANSLLCRLALRLTTIDPVGFAGVRIVCGALVLGAVAVLRERSQPTLRGSWSGAIALFAYVLCFSLAYRGLSAGSGALLLFGAVQLTMIGHALRQGERLGALATTGLVCALAGLIGLVRPGLSAPRPAPAGLMALAGLAWGAYSILGRSGGDPLQTTAGNFLRAGPLAVGGALLAWPTLHLDPQGVALAAVSGAITSGLGYTVWYAVLPSLRTTTAATLQLSVPVLAVAGGGLLLGEAVSLRVVISAAAILGGIACVLRTRSARRSA